MNKLNVTVARMHKLVGTSPVKAFADILINDAVLIKGVRVIETARGVKVSMPTEKGVDGKWYSTVILMTAESQKLVNDTILDIYNQ